VGEPIQIIWNNAPGYSYDYISISSIKNEDSSKAVRLYTQGKINGFIQYSNENVKGNWTHWYKASHARWPLAPGTYKVQLMLDDGYTSLASTKVVIKR
jgi:hypothetical protein